MRPLSALLGAGSGPAVDLCCILEIPGDYQRRDWEAESPSAGIYLKQRFLAECKPTFSTVTVVHLIIFKWIKCNLVKYNFQATGHLGHQISAYKHINSSSVFARHFIKITKVFKGAAGPHIWGGPSSLSLRCCDWLSEGSGDPLGRPGSVVRGNSPKKPSVS